MLKAVSSISNAIGALNYKGTWNASTNSPALASGVGTKGDYYVVSVAGTTSLDGISNWGIGDWAVFNGSAWQRVEGGADLNGVNLSVSGTSTLSGLTASTALALNASKEVVSVTNTGSGNNVLATSPSIATPTLTGNVSMTTGNLVVGTDGKGIDFSITPNTGTSELFEDYEEGTWNVGLAPATGSFTSLTFASADGYYRKVGNMVHVCGYFWTIGAITLGTASGQLRITGLPYTVATTVPVGSAWTNPDSGNYNPPAALCTGVYASGTALYMFKNGTVSNPGFNAADLSVGGGNANYFGFSCVYQTT